MTSRLSRDEIWKHLKGAGTIMLTTEGGSGLRSRPMQIVQDEYLGTLYFFTSISSSKVDEVSEEQHVCISGADRDSKAFFSLSGRARVSKDQEMIDKFWHPTVSAWFPKGKDDPECALLEVRVDHVDVWENEENPVLFWYEIVKANLTDSEPDVGRVRHRNESPAAH